MADRNDRSLDDVNASAYQATSNYYSPYLQTPVMSNPYGGYAHHLAPLVTPPMPVTFSNMALANSYQMSYPAASMMAGFQGTPQMNFPQAQFMTPSNLGGFRNLPPSALGGGMFRQRPMAPYMPFPAMPEQSMFGRPEMMAYGYAQQSARYGSAQEIAAMNAGATALTSLAGAGIGAGVGTYFGGMKWWTNWCCRWWFRCQCYSWVTWISIRKVFARHSGTMVTAPDSRKRHRGTWLVGRA